MDIFGVSEAVEGWLAGLFGLWPCQGGAKTANVGPEGPCPMYACREGHSVRTDRAVCFDVLCFRCLRSYTVWVASRDGAVYVYDVASGDLK
eukprot:1394949-Amorphochlora_amoeboformis.AAC.1